MKKITKNFLKMSEIYRIFSRHWQDQLKYDETSLLEMFKYETLGEAIANPEINGFYVGKHWMDVNISMWNEELKTGYLNRLELYDDGTFPEWWLDKVINSGVKYVRQERIRAGVILAQYLV